MYQVVAEVVLKHILLLRHIQQAVGAQVQVAHLRTHHLTQLRHLALHLAHQTLVQVVVEVTDPAVQVEEEDNYSSFNN